MTCASTPALANSERCSRAASSSPNFPTYRVRRPQVWQAIIALATCPPGRKLAFRNSIFEPAEGYSGSGINMSVALSPTPTTSTTADFFILVRNTLTEAYLSLLEKLRLGAYHVDLDAFSFRRCIVPALIMTASASSPADLPRRLGLIDSLSIVIGIVI